MNDGAVVAFEHERECRRYSVEGFTSLYRGDTSFIFWTGPQDCILEKTTGACQATGTPVMKSIAFIVTVLLTLNGWVTDHLLPRAAWLWSHGWPRMLGPELHAHPAARSRRMGCPGPTRNVACASASCLRPDPRPQSSVLAPAARRRMRALHTLHPAPPYVGR